MRDNGNIRRIDVFSMTDARPSQAAQKTAPLPPGVVSNRIASGGEAATTATVILFDLLNTPVEVQSAAIRQLMDLRRSGAPR